MSSDALFFRRQATVQREAAAEATLTNVRERCERAAASWETMASRAERTDKLRTDRLKVPAELADMPPAA